MGDCETRAVLPIRTWFIGAVAAIALHAGALAVTIANLQDTEDDATGGTAAIEIALEPMVARSVPTEPAGLEAEASAAAPEVMEQRQAAEVQTVLPQEVPRETEEPDRVVAVEAIEEVSEETPETVTVPSVPSQASVASEAAAPPAMEAISEAPTTVAKTPDLGREARQVIATWQKQLVAHVDRQKRYPANRAGRGAKITVAFALDRSGRLMSASIVKSSGDPAFDDAAMAMLRRSDPFPAPPPLIADEGLNFTLPIVFRANR